MSLQVCFVIFLFLINHASTSPTLERRAATSLIKCDTKPFVSNFGMVYTGSSKYFDQNPNIYEAFSFRGKNNTAGQPVISSIAANKTRTMMDFYRCTSKYMGYKDDPSSSDTGRKYGIVRIPKLNNDCLMLSSASAKSTQLTHQSCSFTDDTSQNAQYSEIFGTDQGPAILFLGVPFSKSHNKDGYGYANKDDGSNGNNKIISFIRQTGNSTLDGDSTASFYLG